MNSLRSSNTLSSLVVERALELGFARVGILPAGPMRDASRLDDWLSDGFHGEMDYMERHGAIRRDASLLEPWARSFVVVSAGYAPFDDDPSHPDAWARYAVGDDYHLVLRSRLESLAAFIRAETGATTSTRATTDSAPLLERSLAIESGVGWLGKSAMVIDTSHGSYTFLAELAVSVDLAAFGAEHPDRCGRCTRCIDACPTGAIVGPYRVDARRCISYLTIELRGPIPRRLRPGIGGRLFGCDVCQQVCPWNSKASGALFDEFRARTEVISFDAVAALRCTQEEFSRVFRGSAVKRTKRRGLARNAAVVLGNIGDRGSVPALTEAVMRHDEALVRGHSAWALGALGGAAARRALDAALLGEQDPYVREELRWSMERL